MHSYTHSTHTQNGQWPLTNTAYHFLFLLLFLFAQVSIGVVLFLSELFSYGIFSTLFGMTKEDRQMALVRPEARAFGKHLLTQLNLKGGTEARLVPSLCRPHRFDLRPVRPLHRRHLGGSACLSAIGKAKRSKFIHTELHKTSQSICVEKGRTYLP